MHPIRFRVVPLALACLFALSCGGQSKRAPAQAPPPGYQQPPPGYYPPPGYPQAQGQPYGQPPLGAPPGYRQPTQPQGQPPVQPTQPTQPAAQLLPPLVGEAAMRAEVKSILDELIAALPANQQQMVHGIPLVFDPDPNEVNAFAGCDERGASFMAGTVGLLYAVDAIAQTKATDERFGTQTYQAYTNRVLPALAKTKGASPALPQGIITPQQWADPARLSRARELFDNVIAFTFGHELAHHYLGHTGCANGQGGSGPNPARLGHLATAILPGLNQPNEIASDSAGCVNVLNAGRRRRPRNAWDERGGYLLLGYFAELERHAGVALLSPVGFLRSHPNPQIRIPIVQTVARTWHAQNPG